MGLNSFDRRIVFSLVRSVSGDDLIKDVMDRLVADCKSVFGNLNVIGGQVYSGDSLDRDYHDRRMGFLLIRREHEEGVKDFLRGYKCGRKLVVDPVLDVRDSSSVERQKFK